MAAHHLFLEKLVADDSSKEALINPAFVIPANAGIQEFQVL